MAAEICRHGHDHTVEPVWIPTPKRGRKYHSANAPHASTYQEDAAVPKTSKESRYSDGTWRRGSLREAVDAGMVSSNARSALGLDGPLSNIAVDQTAGSPALAAAAHRGRWTVDLREQHDTI